MKREQIIEILKKWKIDTVFSNDIIHLINADDDNLLAIADEILALQRDKPTELREERIWQKCPACDGRKVIYADPNYPVYGTIDCPVCGGSGILDQYGKPPANLCTTKDLTDSERKR